MQFILKIYKNTTDYQDLEIIISEILRFSHWLKVDFIKYSKASPYFVSLNLLSFSIYILGGWCILTDTNMGP
jgi:hypothetical protein